MFREPGGEDGEVRLERMGWTRGSRVGGSAGGADVYRRGVCMCRGEVCVCVGVRCVYV